VLALARVNSTVMRLLFANRTIPVIILFLCLAGCRPVHAPSNASSNPTVTQAQKTPFTLSIVPTGSNSASRFITIASQNPHEFYVVLTNISNEPQSVWETRNSWGSRTISFEFIFGNNPPILVARGPEGFTMNFPSTFVIPPGEHKVYPIRLDKWWDTAGIPKSDETPVIVRTIYEVPNTPEASQYKVWVGRVESPKYELTLTQW
jgi:hypothetical protein